MCAGPSGSCTARVSSLGAMADAVSIQNETTDIHRSLPPGYCFSPLFVPSDCSLLLLLLRWVRTVKLYLVSCLYRSLSNYRVTRKISGERINKKAGDKDRHQPKNRARRQPQIYYPLCLNFFLSLFFFLFQKMVFWYSSSCYDDRTAPLLSQSSGLCTTPELHCS